MKNVNKPVCSKYFGLFSLLKPQLSKHDIYLSSPYYRLWTAILVTLLKIRISNFVVKDIKFLSIYLRFTTNKFLLVPIYYT